ncbi:MAG: TspO/MBR family protein [Ferruginibacter sp.]
MNIFKQIRFWIAILIPVLVGSIAGFFTSSGVKGWYAVANKPSFNPPNWIFAPVWFTLYLLMGIAFYLIWRKETVSTYKRTAITVYVVQLTFNFFWSFIFFYLQEPGWAFVEILLMWTSIVGTIFYFSKINKLAAALLIPYILWVSFASVLNYFIWYLN